MMEKIAFLLNFHFSEGEVVEMASEVWSDSIPSTSRRPHGTDKINIYQLLKSTLKSARLEMNVKL